MTGHEARRNRSAGGRAGGLTATVAVAAAAVAAAGGCVRRTADDREAYAPLRTPGVRDTATAADACCPVPGPVALPGPAGTTEPPAGPAKPDAALAAVGIREVADPDGTRRLDASGLVAEMLRRWSAVRDYTCKTEKREWVGGGLERLPHEMDEFVRLSPLSLHLLWTGEVNRGRHALWVEGKHGGKMMIHPNPIFGIGTMRIDPGNSLTRTQSKYDFRDAGLQGMMKALPKSLRPGGTTWTYLGEGEAFGRPTWRLRGTDPTDDPLEHNLIEMHVDREWLLPVHFVGRNREGRINIAVSFRDIRTDVGLTDADFDPDRLW